MKAQHQRPAVGVVIPTLNAAGHLRQVLPPLLNSVLRPRVLVVDSSSGDGSPELALTLGAEVMTISRSSFNHGSTREMARRQIGTPIVVMMTQDAHPACEDLLEKLVAPVLNGQAALSYARQIPQAGAGLLESFPRAFNYPDRSHIRRLDDGAALGAYLFFCSNSCAAYDTVALDRVGGFPHVLTAEDTFAAARLLRAGYRIAYVAEAVVEHSHRYTLTQEFRRHFDTGCVRASEPEVFTESGDHQRGAAYARLLLRHVLANQPWLAPAAIASLVAKYSGYRIGRSAHLLPAWLCRRLSASPGYWDSPVIEKPEKGAGAQAPSCYENPVSGA